jgi:hypothetical protein
LETGVVLGALALEIVRDVEDWFAQDIPLAKEERDEETPQTPVAVQKGMDCFELSMSDTDLREIGEASLGVKEPFEIGQEIRHFLGLRRNVGRLGRSGPWGSDPVLDPTELARGAVPPSDSLHQPRVNLAEKSYRHGTLLQSIEPEPHRRHVVLDFEHVAGTVRVGNARLGSQKIIECAACSLDAAREDGLLPDVHEDEEVRVRQVLDRTVEAAQGALGAIERFLAVQGCLE